MNADGEQSLCSSLCKEFLLDLFVMCGFLHSHQDYFFLWGEGFDACSNITIYFCVFMRKSGIGGNKIL